MAERKVTLTFRWHQVRQPEVYEVRSWRDLGDKIELRISAQQTEIIPVTSRLKSITVVYPEYEPEE